MTKQNDETQIHKVIEDWAAGLRAKDAKRVTAPRHRRTGALFARAAARRRQERSLWAGKMVRHLGWSARLRSCAISRSSAGDGVAFSHSLNHLTGTSNAARSSDLWFRSTLGFRKIGGEWKIVHEHESVPFLMDGSDKAALDLKPQT